MKLHDKLGLPRPTGSISVQRLAHVQTSFFVAADPPPVVHIEEEPISAAVFTLMVLLMVSTVGVTLAMGFRRGAKGSEAIKFGAVGEGDRVHALGPSGRTVLASLSSHFFSARALRASATAAGVADVATVHASGVRVVVDDGSRAGADLEDLASVASRVFAAPTLPGATMNEPLAKDVGATVDDSAFKLG